MQKWEQIQGVYIHTPFCLQKCLYCDFASYAGAGADTETMEKYVDAVCSEIMMRSNEVTMQIRPRCILAAGLPRCFRKSFWRNCRSFAKKWMLAAAGRGND